MTVLGKFISDQIESQKITAREMAGRMQLSETTLSSIIHGRRASVSLKTFCRMAVGISKSQAIRIKFFLAVLKDSSE